MATSQFSIIKTNLHDIGFPFLHPADCDSTKIPKNPIPAKPPSPKSYQHSGKSPDFTIIELGIIPDRITCVVVGLCVRNLRKFYLDLDSSGVCHELSFAPILADLRLRARLVILRWDYVHPSVHKKRELSTSTFSLCEKHAALPVLRLRTERTERYRKSDPSSA